MILIRSSRRDLSTGDVIDWMRYLGCNHIYRCNDDVEVKAISYHLGNSNKSSYFKTTGATIDFYDLDAVWYRRGKLTFGNIVFPDSFSQSLTDEVTLSCEKHNDKILEAIDLHLLQLNGLNCFADNKINKLAVLKTAHDIGLLIPESIITNEISTILAFANEKEEIITKSLIYPTLSLDVDGNYVTLTSYTRRLSKQEVNALYTSTEEEHIHVPSFFQEFIEKRYEIRTFYLDRKVFSMAIFSQALEETKTDFRYNSHALRSVPYKLPEEIEQKIVSLMEELKLNSGSIDILYTINHDYVFLEVNPIGQYQWLTKNCNYFIDKEIALWLIKQRRNGK